MPTVKYDVTGSDPEKAKAGTFEQPKPGVYVCKIKSVTPGFSKGDDNKPDQTRPRIEVVYEIQDKAYKGSQLWEYLTFGERAIWKLDQFGMAVGLWTEKAKRKGSFTTEGLVGKLVKVRVKGGKKQDGEYRAEVGSVFPPDADVGGPGEDELLTGEEDEVAIDGGGDDDLDALGAAADDEGDEDAIARLTELAEENGLDINDFGPWTDLAEALKEAGDGGGEADNSEERRAELTKTPLAELRTIASSVSVDPAGIKKADLVEAIIAAESEPEDGIVLEDDTGTYLTEAQLKAMESAELVATARQFDIEVKKGATKSGLIAKILEAQAAPAAGEDELPF